MPDLLLELFSEEIPARMQAAAAEDLRRLVADGLVDAGLTYEGARAFATPRRLSLTVQGLTARSAETREERRGPRVGAPQQALEGFLRAAGLASIADAEIRSDPKKGDFYVAMVVTPGRSAEDIIATLLPAVIRDFPWPKAMRWGAGSAPAAASESAPLRWVRPLRSILCTFGPETEEPVIVDFEIGGIRSGNFTFGHRFLAGPEPLPVRRFDDYVATLERAKVVLDPERRKAVIETEAKQLAFAQGLDLVEDTGLLDEVAGLVEWPVVLMGSFDPDFLAIPDEVIRLTIRNNQKCFVLRDPKTGALTNRFILVANIEARDGGKAIVAGNQRVIAARLSDARFFWEQDRKVPLEVHARKLAAITFHERLGSQAERVERIARLAREIAPLVGAEPAEAERAARLAKADLVTGMVGEFPEVQGIMGRYYALAEGEPASVADAIRDHYRPQGPADAVPDAPVSIAVALADKLDMLVGFWAIDEKPTGSKDPFALRRAALGVIRIVLANAVRLRLKDRLVADLVRLGQTIGAEAALDQAIDVAVATRGLDLSAASAEEIARKVEQASGAVLSPPAATAADLLAFFADRLKVHLRDEGARHDLIDAVFALPEQDDLLMIVRRVEALAAFLASEDGANLLTGYRRAANILRAEEKKDGLGAFDAEPDAALIEAKGLPEERVLHHVMQAAEAHARTHVAEEDFERAMRALAELRPAVDAFFDKVTVNAEEPEIRANRLRLLNQLRRATLTVADFSRIGG